MIRALVVDDESLGRRGVLSRLARRKDVSVIGDCRNGREALAALEGSTPDLLFLDVKMPGLDGFELLGILPDGSRPHVIFVTAFDRHALHAFEVHALDYLLKPIDDDRFDEAVDRAVRIINQERDGELGRQVAGLVAANPAEASLSAPRPATTHPASDRYPIRIRGRVLFVRHAEIDWVGAEGDYVRVHAGEKSWLVRTSMNAVERDLPSRRFVRIHRSTLVAADRVREMRSLDSGDCAVLLRDGTELRVGRSYRAAFETSASIR